MIVKQFIRKTQSVSSTQWEILPQLPQIFEKNQNTFGNLFETLNCYLVHGKQEILQNPQRLETFIDLAHKSMNSTKASINVHNAEGAIMM